MILAAARRVLRIEADALGARERKLPADFAPTNVARIEAALEAMA